MLSLGASHRQLITSRHGPNHDILLLDTLLLELGDTSVHEGGDDGFVPSCVDDQDALIGAVVLLGRGTEAFDGCVGHCQRVDRS